MTLEGRVRRLEQRMAPSPDQGPTPHCTCYSHPPTFRSEAEMEAALQQQCPVHGRRFRFCLVAPLTLTEEEWRRRQPKKLPAPEEG